MKHIQFEATSRKSWQEESSSNREKTQTSEIKQTWNKGRGVACVSRILGSGHDLITNRQVACTPGGVGSGLQLIARIL